MCKEENIGMELLLLEGSGYDVDAADRTLTITQRVKYRDYAGERRMRALGWTVQLQAVE